MAHGGLGLAGPGCRQHAATSDYITESANVMSSWSRAAATEAAGNFMGFLVL